MKSTCKWIVLISLCIIACISVSKYCNAAVNGDTSLAPFTIDFTLRTKEKILVGEPIVLHYRIVRIADGLTIGTKSDLLFNQWYALSVSKSNGESLPLHPDQRAMSIRGAYAAPLPILRSNEIKEGDIVVNRYFDLHEVGSYTLHVSTNMRYVTLKTHGKIPNDLNAQVEASNLAFSKNFEFKINLSKPAVGELRTLASRMRERCAGASDTATQKEAMLELFSMPPESAVSSWRALATDSSIGIENRIYAAKLLALTNSTQGVDILIDIELKFPIVSNTGHNEISIMLLLRQMFDSGSDELKKYIVNAIKERHVTEPFLQYDD